MEAILEEYKNTIKILDKEAYTILKQLPKNKQEVIKQFNEEWDFLFRCENPDRNIANMYIENMIKNRIIFQVTTTNILHLKQSTKDILKLIDLITDISSEKAVKSVEYKHFTREI